MAEKMSLGDVWTEALRNLKRLSQFSDTMMNLWFNDLELLYLNDDIAVFDAQREFKYDIITEKYRPAIADALEATLGRRVEVQLRCSGMGKIDLSEFGEAVTHKPSSPTELKDPSLFTTVGDSSVVNYALVSRSYKFSYTFGTFIVGSSNKFAHAASIAVARNPAREYNPLFIHGKSGLGKTHLLYAIIDEASRVTPGLNIVYVNGEDFTNQMIDSISRGITAQFREKYRGADMLLIDDIQFIAGKESTQEEFFHTYNTLYESGKQIIMTSDRPPKEIKTLEERLRTRFEWGLIADIQPPDYELRSAILKSKAETLGVSLPPDVLDYVAENLTNNVRQLEGAVRKIAAQSFLNGSPITLSLAVTCIADLIVGSEPVSTVIDRVLRAVSNHFDVSVEVLKGKKRSRDISFPRHVSIYIIRKLTDMSLPAIGKIFSRDHTTILNSLDAVETELKNNPSMELEVSELIREIKEMR